MSKDTDIHFRWEGSRMSAFLRCAKKLGTGKQNEVAREIIEAWVACQISPAERKSLGFTREWQYSEPVILTKALRLYVRADRRRGQRALRRPRAGREHYP